MIKIIVDGKNYVLDETNVWHDVGSAAPGSDVCLSGADAKHITIRVSYIGYLVEIHSAKGIMCKNKLRLRDPDGWYVYVQEGEPVTIGNHEIKLQRVGVHVPVL